MEFHLQFKPGLVDAVGGATTRDNSPDNLSGPARQRNHVTSIFPTPAADLKHLQFILALSAFNLC